MEEDGFHSISWDDAPPRAGFADMSGVGEDDDDGFDKISPSSPDEHFGAASTSTVRPEETVTHRTAFEPGDYEWDGRWMSIEVKDPVKEHEGSKDMFVSYAVQTRVRRGSVGVGRRALTTRPTSRRSRSRRRPSAAGSRTLPSSTTTCSRASRLVSFRPFPTSTA